MPTPRRTLCFTCGLVLATLAAMVGCSGSQKRPMRAVSVMPVKRDVPQVFRGTVGSVATFAGIDSVLVTGYGLVWGLRGTGGGLLPEAVAGHMEREMGLRGIGRGAQLPPGSPLAWPDGRGKSPRELLRDPNVAVVVVYARIPPGAPMGYPFDVFVQAVNATSLESGTLLTTDLQIGPSEPFGGYQKKQIAQARGPIFVNPFGEPGTGDRGSVNLQVGRVLYGGAMTEPLKIDIQLDEPSHQRARLIENAINSRFPRFPGDRDRTARGRNDAGIALTVPERFRLNPGDFVKMVQYMPFDINIPPEEFARRYVEAMEAEPSLAPELKWSLRSLGERAIPLVRRLYDSPDIVPRMAALEVGAALGDAVAAEAILPLAMRGPSPRRVEAIRLLGMVEGVVRVDVALRELADNDDPTIRIAAYESLAARAQRIQQRRLAAAQADLIESSGRFLSVGEIESLSSLWLPGDSIQGVKRTLVSGKYLLDTIESSRPGVYITQQGIPRIAIFGNAVVRRPLLVEVWKDRLMLAADPDDDDIRIFHRDARGRAQVITVKPSIEEIIRVLSHTPTVESPRPGLGFNYAEVVAAINAIWQTGALVGDFTTEQDRLLAELIEATRSMAAEDRPERPGETPRQPLPLPAIESELPTAPRIDDAPRIVPIRPTDAGA
ncbi:MAG: flagellar basal body P-ring protein FlgI [Phycisphaeraceae bacterium]|nr:flagellar basal body P-ring protein FlgI [Phycisphaeraceae bacterium]MCW5754599.1 flagellar basal body P-ring protein FlgI [Phycisphaeraceae bacterium]